MRKNHPFFKSGKQHPITINSYASIFLDGDVSEMNSSSSSFANDPQMYNDAIAERKQNMKIVDSEVRIVNGKRKRDIIRELISDELIHHAKDPVYLIGVISQIKSIDDFKLEYTPISFKDEKYTSLNIHVTIGEDRPLEDRRVEFKFRINWKITD